jgi:hypothetical protein
MISNDTDRMIRPMINFRPRKIVKKCWYLPTSLHDITTQKTNDDIFTAVRTSNLTNSPLYAACNARNKNVRNKGRENKYDAGFHCVLRVI